jgi:hypothetical protein
MTLFTILIAVGLIAISFIGDVVSATWGKSAAARFSRRFGLEVPPGMEGAIRASVRARRIGAPIGTTVAVTIAAVLLLVVLPGFQLLAIWWCLFGSYLLGAGVGSTVGILVTERRRERGVVRVARTTTVKVSDYVSPLQTAFMWFCVAAAIVLFAGDLWLTATNSPEYLSIVSGLLVGLSVVALVVYQVLARRAVSRGALAGTPLELAWDDGLRSYALVNLSSMVALIALYSLVAYDTVAIIATPKVADQTIFGVYVGLLPISATVGIITLIVVITSIHTRQHFLRRLWPEFAPPADETPSTIPTELMGSGSR